MFVLRFFVCCLILLSFSSIGEAQVSPPSPSTLGQPTYPNSGSTRNRGNVMGGASSASSTSNVEGLEVPSRNPDRQEEQDETIQQGPYNLKGEYQYWSPDKKK